MDKKKQAKLITLAVSLVVVLGTAGLIYGRHLANSNNAASDGEETLPPGISAELLDPDTIDETNDSAGQEQQVNDHLILISGGTFSMGSPSTER